MGEVQAVSPITVRKSSYNPQMHSRRPLISAVLAAALLLGQWLGAGHDSDHGLQPGAAHACAVCVYSHGAGLLPVIARLALEHSPPAPEIFTPGHPLAATLHHHPIRGPPALLV